MNDEILNQLPNQPNAIIDKMDNLTSDKKKKEDFFQILDREQVSCSQFVDDCNFLAILQSDSKLKKTIDQDEFPEVQITDFNEKMAHAEETNVDIDLTCKEIMGAGSRNVITVPHSKENTKKNGGHGK